MKIIPFKIPKTDKESFLLQEDLLPIFYDKFHQHSEIQLTVILAGEGTLIAGDYIGNFYPSEVYLIGSNLPHVFKSELQEGVQAHSFSVFFDEKSFGNFLELPECQKVMRFIQQSKNGMKILGKSQELIAEKLPQLLQKEDFERMLVLLELLNMLAKSKGLQSLSSYETLKSYDLNKGKRMNDIISFTIEASNREITLEEVAQIANMTPQAFCRYFKTHTRKTYTNFLNELRISNACKILINKDLAVHDVSVQVGFNNISHFNRTFKKVTGFSPSEYLCKRGKGNSIF